MSKLCRQSQQILEHFAFLSLSLDMLERFYVFATIPSSYYTYVYICMYTWALRPFAEFV
jgi:hypothetical protein